jgi:dTDP-4-amino-4,6-dideoxygalactose transaminase
MRLSKTYNIKQVIPFNRPALIGNESKHVDDAINSEKLSGDGKYSELCHNWFEQNLRLKKVLLTPSCTHALELIALLIEIQPGDEVIMPSYTFVSTANAFALRGAHIVFVDIRSDTLNIDETKIENAINNKTKAIVAVHYAGVACEMNYIMQLAEKHNLYVIEDAAQAIMCKYNDDYLGSIGHFSTFSFHETKNTTSGGEGGLLIINDESFIEKAEIVREKGTNRSAYFRGMSDKYSWVNIGSSYLMNDLSAAFLWGQLQNINIINNKRLKIWSIYYDSLIAFQEEGVIRLPNVPKNCFHNGHLFYLIFENINMRADFINYTRRNKINTPFHYVPLHTSAAGKKHGKFVGTDTNTTNMSERLVRLPLFFNLEANQIKYVIEKTIQFLTKIS